MSSYRNKAESAAAWSLSVRTVPLEHGCVWCSAARVQIVLSIGRGRAGAQGPRLPAVALSTGSIVNCQRLAVREATARTSLANQ